MADGTFSSADAPRQARIAEASLFSRYVGGFPAPPHLLQRYQDALAALALDAEPAPDSPECRLLRAARGGVLMLGFMDAGAAIVSPRCLLRRRLLVMAGVLEASPEYTAEYLSAPSGKLAQAASLLCSR